MAVENPLRKAGMRSTIEFAGLLARHAALGAVLWLALEFANTNSGGTIFTPSVVYDGDGCQLGSGSILPMPVPGPKHACSVSPATS